ncbi:MULTISPECIES: 1-phosphofructokinase [Thermoactinomyces]|jgi:1-phosphofructokinase|uniref:Tagatose-6-phosphate kinase n=1 Tax=Thermoactinomyces daqus TaxID=1329516 RepID=A0A7W2AI05_9BACL|nr:MULTISPECIES: 1-phosphofructokinase [Thermoactinomyces]MBA4543301.1 1-phosphofructokinase [Thermoactinomyces daqus]MBH8598442.1 1-phosphofructokinase [Thermoactinomyces sp. CICC 10523]MBH8604713.1 1-phosphofructokinase [Thermoactinomyces sp. CICC 10522]
MIYTVTLNPSIDLVVNVPSFQLNGLNRMQKEQKFPGGKGINVSRVLSRLGAETTALGFIGGFTGAFIRDTLHEEGIGTDFIRVDGDSRINIKLKTEDGETEINGQGPSISEEQIALLREKLNALAEGDVLVLAGSIPRSLPAGLYEDLTGILSPRGVKVVVDASGEALGKVIAHRPFLIKPNHHELGELFGVTLTNAMEILPYGHQLLEQGARHVIVSMAGAGALLFAEEGTYQATVPQGKVINSVGAGDSLVAGFLSTYVRTGDLLESFRCGIAAGSATAFSSDLCTKNQVEQLLPQVKIKPVVHPIDLGAI